jgi:hypothetical protein
MKNKSNTMLVLNFECSEGELILVDEADAFIMSQTVKFSTLIDGHCCICFTATPDNCDAKGSEAKLITTLGFKIIKYMINNAV